ncbi:MBL fold metallo-hydrolase [Szabonella alba]|uniref:MBL fold metallo-hydrolase n=1 Tax=Szabonella alba TaxID=2804194 RepID=A0A8K0Y0H9_9RHOB|nr:MBL fold metallo-hydrolase [Szabonella alba]MBL4917866.1 MBL fold metallo-hydrolase [Szabonella alba]
MAEADFFLPPGQPGVPVWLQPDLRLVRADNPSPFTGAGTNSYLLGRGAVVLVDPGPDLDAHARALMAALGPDERITEILVTHAHADHSALAPRIAALNGARVLAFGDALAGRSERMQALAEAEAQQGGRLGGGEGVDAGFRPDQCLADGESLTTGAGRITAIHTPGHMANHLCLDWQGHLFSGDHVMGWSSSIVSPPDGDMAQYRAALLRLQAGGWQRAFPGHGAPIADLPGRIAALLAHRAAREAAILAVMEDEGLDLPDLTARVYGDTPRALWPAASRNLLAHLIDLADRGLVRADPAPGPMARFSRNR